MIGKICSAFSGRYVPLIMSPVFLGLSIALVVYLVGLVGGCVDSAREQMSRLVSHKLCEMPRFFVICVFQMIYPLVV